MMDAMNSKKLVRVVLVYFAMNSKKLVRVVLVYFAKGVCVCVNNVRDGVKLVK